MSKDKIWTRQVFNNEAFLIYEKSRWLLKDKVREIMHFSKLYFISCGVHNIALIEIKTAIYAFPVLLQASLIQLVKTSHIRNLIKISHQYLFNLL